MIKFLIKGDNIRNRFSGNNFSAWLIIEIEKEG